MQIIGAIKSQGYGIITQEALLKILKTRAAMTIFTPRKTVAAAQ